MKTETRPFYYFKKGEQIVKHSKNITDLLEIGDSISVLLDPITNYFYKLHIQSEEQLKIIKENPQIVKRIVTKEQYAAIEYKIETEGENEKIHSI